MKRFLTLFFMLLFLTGCSFTEKRIEKNVLEDLEESYHITEAEVTSIEKQNVQAPFIVFALSRIFAGKDYDVEVKIDDSVSTEMTGIINNRELSLQNKDYVRKKHEKLEPEDESYQGKIDELSEMGLEIERVKEGHDADLYQAGTRLVNFEIESEKEVFDAEKAYQILKDLSDDILEKIDTMIEIEVIIPANNYLSYRDNVELSTKEIEEKMEEEQNEIKLEYEEDREVLDQLKSTLNAAKLNQNFDTEMVQKMQDIDLVLVVGKFMNRVDVLETEFIHELSFINEDDLDDEKIFELVELLREEGFNESYISFINRPTGERFNQVDKIKTIEDVEKYF